MERFNLKKYLANPSIKVVTREGYPVRILCTDARRDYPIIALVEEEDGIDNTATYLLDGTYLKGETHNYDLFFDTEKKEGWVNLYRTEDGDERLGCFRHTEEEARMEASGDNMNKHIATVKLEWEE